MLPCAKSITTMSFVEYEKNTVISLPIHEIGVQFPFRFRYYLTLFQLTSIISNLGSPLFAIIIIVIGIAIIIMIIA